MADGDDFSRGYIKGFKEGLFEAWNELIKLTSKGYTPRELQIMIRSARSSFTQKIDNKKRDIEKTLGRSIFSEEKESVAGISISDLSPGMSICLKEDQPKKGIELVKRLVESGSELLSISRKHPAKLWNRLGISGKMIWLSKSDRNDSEREIEFISPTNLPVLAEAIGEFLDEKENGVLFLEGLEYLFTQNDFKSVLKFVQLINEKVLIRNGYLILSVNPPTMEPREFSLVEREMSQVA